MNRFGQGNPGFDLALAPCVQAGRVGLLALVLGAIIIGGAGCASSEQDSVSERPWNAPKGWEHGLPPQLYDRDR